MRQPPSLMKKLRGLQNGFTAIELLVTFAVFAILVSAAVSNFSNQIQQTQALSASEAFSKLVANARVQASQKGMKISLAVSGDKKLDTSGWKDGCGDAVWGVYQFNNVSNKNEAISCLSAKDFDKRYKAPQITVNGGEKTETVVYQPTGIASNDTISVSFIQGDKKSTVTILPGGTASVGK